MPKFERRMIIMTRFKIIHNTANKELAQDGLTPIDKIFCGEFNEGPKFFEIVYDRESYPYPELMETVYEKVRDYLEPNCVFSIYEFNVAKKLRTLEFMWMQKRRTDICLMKTTLSLL